MSQTLVESFIKGLKSALQQDCSAPEVKMLLTSIVVELYTRLSELEEVVVRSSSVGEEVQGLAVCVRCTESWRDLMKETPVSETFNICYVCITVYHGCLKACNGYSKRRDHFYVYLVAIAVVAARLG